MKIGYWTYGYEMAPLEVALPQIAAIGYEGIELCIQRGYGTPVDSIDDRRIEEIKQLLAANHLEAAAVDAQWGIVAPSPADWEERRALFERSMEIAGALGAPIVELSAGGIPTGWERERAWAALVANTRELVRMAKERHLTLALEGHIRAIVEHPRDSLALLKEVDDPTLRLNVDVVHPTVLGYTLEEIAAQLGPHAVFAHVSDARGRYPDYAFSTPGEGAIDWPRYLGLLKSVGYDGYLMVQIPGMRRKLPGYDPLIEAKRAYETVRGALSETVQ